MAKVGFIGLGNMGGPMAKNLLKAGHQVSVFDLVPAACDALAKEGALKASTARDAITDADYLISMLPAGKHVAETYIGESGLLEMIGTETCVLDCSTIDAETARKVGQTAQKSNIGFMDAPVSGGVAAAAAGTLSFMCGGAQDTFEKAKLILKDMGTNIFHAGPHGSGQVAKGCNTMLLAIHMLGTAEALAMGAKHNLDPKVLSKIMLASSGRNWSLEVYNPYPGVMDNAPASNDYQPGFMVDLMLKDLRLALEIADTAGIDNAMGKLAKELYEKHQEAGHGSLDFSSVQTRLT